MVADFYREISCVANFRSAAVRFQGCLPNTKGDCIQARAARDVTCFLSWNIMCGELIWLCGPPAEGARDTTSTGGKYVTPSLAVLWHDTEHVTSNDCVLGRASDKIAGTCVESPIGATKVSTHLQFSIRNKSLDMEGPNFDFWNWGKV